MINLRHNYSLFQSFLLIFELISTGKLTPNTTLRFELFDVSCGSICCNYISNTNLKSLSKALYSNVPIKYVKFKRFRNPSFGGIVALFEILSFNRSLIEVDIEPHSIDLSTGIITFEGKIYNNDLDYLLKAVESNIPIKRVKCKGLREPNLEGLIALYQIHSINKSLIDLNVSPHSFDISLGSIRYEGEIRNADLKSLLKALKTNVRISRVECRDVKRFLSLKEILILFEIYSIQKSIIDLNIAPHCVDLENGVFAFAPKWDLVSVTVEEILYLQTFLELHSIKELTLNRCRFSGKTIAALCDLIRSNHVLTSIDLSHCSFGKYFWNILSTIQSKPGLVNLNLSYSYIQFKNLLNIFGLYSAHKLTSIVDVTPRLLDVGNGIIKFGAPLVASEANSLVKSLRSKLPIKRVECPGLKNPSLKTLFSLYKFIASKRLLEMSVSPSVIDIDQGIIHFEYSPQRFYRSCSCSCRYHRSNNSDCVTQLYQINTKRISQFINFLKNYSIKKAILNGCYFEDKAKAVMIKFLKKNSGELLLLLNNEPVGWIDDVFVPIDNEVKCSCVRGKCYN
ncbi:hypothetical protein GEMRC1_003338 [Eukaryota sp. GEM-RC1]